MSVTSTNSIPSVSGLLEGLSAFAAKFGNAMLMTRGLEARIETVEALQGKSDAELQALGLRRDQIASRVFHDLFYT